MQQAKAKRGKKIISFLLTIALVMTLLPANLVFATNATIVFTPADVIEGTIITVNLTGLKEGNTTIKVMDGTAKYGSTDYRTQLGGSVISTAPGSGRGATFENVVVLADDGGEATINIKLASGLVALNRKTFSIEVTGADGTKVTKELTITEPSDQAPEVEVGANKTIVASGGYTPTGDLKYSYTFDGVSTGTKDLELGVTQFPSNVVVSVWVDGDTTNVAYVSFANVAVNTTGITAITSTANINGIDTTLTFSYNGNNRWQAEYSAINANQPGLNAFNQVNVTELNNPTPWADVKANAWAFNAVTGTWTTTVPAYPGLTLHVAVKQAISSPDLKGWQTSGRPSEKTLAIKSAQYYTNETAPASYTPGNIWWVNGNSKVDGLNLTGFGYTVLLNDDTPKTRDELLAMNGVTEAFTILSANQVRLVVTYNNAVTGRTTSVEDTIMLENFITQNGIAQVVITKKDGVNFYVGHAASSVTSDKFDFVVKMADGTVLTDSDTYNGDAIDTTDAILRTQASSTAGGDVTGTLAEGTIYFGVKVTIGSLNAPGYSFADVEVTELDASVGAFANATAMTNGYVTTTGSNGFIISLDPTDGDLDPLSGSETITLTDGTTDIILTYTSDKDGNKYLFKGTVPASTEGLFTVKAVSQNYKSSGLDVSDKVEAALQTLVGSGIKIDTKPIVLTGAETTGTKLVVTFEDKFLADADEAIIRTAITSALGTGTSTSTNLLTTADVLSISKVDDKVTLVWNMAHDESPKADWTGNIVVTDLANRASNTLGVTFTYVAATTPLVFGTPAVAVTTPGFATTVDATVNLTNTGSYTGGYKIYWKVFGAVQDTSAWTIDTVDDNKGNGSPKDGWAKVTDTTNITGIDENGYLYVYVVGSVTGSGDNYGTQFVQVTNVLDQTPRFGTMVYEQDGDGKNKGVEAAAVDGAVIFTAYAYDNVKGNPAVNTSAQNVTLKELYFAVIDEATLNGIPKSGDTLTAAELVTWLNGNGSTHKKTVYTSNALASTTIIAGAGNNTDATNAGYELGSKNTDVKVRVPVTKNGDVVVIYSESTTGEATWTKSEVFAKIDNPTTATVAVAKADGSALGSDWLKDATLNIKFTVSGNDNVQTTLPLSAVLWIAVPTDTNPSFAAPDKLTDSLNGWNRANLTELLVADNVSYIAQGEKDIWAVAYSSIGNKIGTAQKIATVKYDNVAPATLASAPVKQTAHDEYNFTLTATDATSGLKEFYYAAKSKIDPTNPLEGADLQAALDGFDWTTSGTKLELEAVSQAYTLELTSDSVATEYYVVAVDTAGNVSHVAGNMTGTLEITVPATPKITAALTSVKRDDNNDGAEYEHNYNLTASNTFAERIPVGKQALQVILQVDRSAGAQGWGDAELTTLATFKLYEVNGSGNKGSEVSLFAYNSGNSIWEAATITPSYTDKGGKAWTRTATAAFNLSSYAKDATGTRLTDGAYLIEITTADNLTTPLTGNTISIYIELETEELEVSSLKFSRDAFIADTPGQGGAGAPMSAGSSPAGSPADITAPVALGDEIYVELVFNKVPVVTAGKIEITIGEKDDVELVQDANNPLRFTGSYEVTAATETQLAPNSATTGHWASANTNLVPDDYGWVDQTATTDGIRDYVLNNFYSSTAWKGYGYIMYTINVSNSAGSNCVLLGTTGFSVTDIEPKVVGDVLITNDGFNNAWSAGIFGNALDGNLILTFTTNTQITPFITAFGEDYGNQYIGNDNPIGTVLEFNLLDGSGNEYIYTVDLNNLEQVEFDEDSGAESYEFKAGAATLTYDEDFETTGSYVNTLTIPVSLFMDGFKQDVNTDGVIDGADSGGTDFDWSESADITFKLTVKSVSGVETAEPPVTTFKSLANGALTDELDKMEFKNILAEVEVYAGAGETLELDFTDLFTELDSADDESDVIAALADAPVLTVPAGGKRTFWVKNVMSLEGNSNDSLTYVYRKVMSESDAAEFILDGVYPDTSEPGWNGAAYNGETGYNKQTLDFDADAANDGEYIVIVAKSWTGDVKIYAVKIVAETLNIEIGAASTGVGYVKAADATVVYGKVSSGDPLGLASITVQVLTADSTVVTVNDIVLPDNTSTNITLDDGTVIGTIVHNNSANTYTVTITASGVYRVTATSGLGVKVITVFELDTSN